MHEVENALHEAEHALGKVAATSAASDAGAKEQAVGINAEDLIKDAATKLGAPAHWKLEDVKDDNPRPYQAFARQSVCRVIGEEQLG